MVRVNEDVLNLHRVANTECQQCSNREERKKYSEDDICKISSVQDGLPVRCVGDWAEEKICRLIKYFGIFVNGMKNSWAGLNYVEICSGPGRCVVRDSGEEIDGTALAILNHPKRHLLKKALFIDLDHKVVQALNQRIQELGFQDKAEAVIGNYKNPDEIVRLLQVLPTRCLNLVFIDPTQCDVPFLTVKEIVSTIKNVDLIVNVTVGTDPTRNIRRAVIDPSFEIARRKYEQFLGNEGFFRDPDVIAAAERNDIVQLRLFFSEAYSSHLADLGFIYRDAREVRHYYYLLFASRSKKGLDFWRKACTYSPKGQKEFSF